MYVIEKFTVCENVPYFSNYLFCVVSIVARYKVFKKKPAALN